MVVTRSEILSIVSQVTGIDVEDIAGNRRIADVVLARFVSAYLMRYYCPTGCTYAAIGLALGGRHHTTILHAVESVVDVLGYPAINPPLATLAAACEAELLKKFGSDAKKMDWVVDNR